MSTIRIKASALLVATGIALLVSMGCSEIESPSTTGPEIAFARGGNGNGGGPGGGNDIDYFVDVTLDAGFALSDDGSADYVTGECGVEGEIWEGGSEDVTMTPGKNWKVNLGCAKRFFVVDLSDGVDESGNPVSLGSNGTLIHLAILDLNVLAAVDDLWVQAPAQFLGEECERLRYDSGNLPGSTKVSSRAPWTSDDVWVMKVAHPSDPAKRAWKVQTSNPSTGVQEDRASCLNPDKGNKLRLDGTFRVPLSLVIVEQ